MINAVIYTMISDGWMFEGQQAVVHSEPVLLPAVLPCSCHLQTSGAVRDTVKLANSAFWYKVYIAAAAAAAEQSFELTLLNRALGLLKLNMIDSLPRVWNATNQAHRDAFDVQQMRNASCICTNGTLALVGTFGYTNAATYLSTNCSGEQNASLVFEQLVRRTRSSLAEP